MPFGSYADEKSAIENGIRFFKEGETDCIKIECDIRKVDILKALSREGMNVMAHIGLMPQFVKSDGGYKIKGKDEREERELIDSALAMEGSGAVMLLLEGIKSEVAEKITKSVKIPTIGIGSGRVCDWQILVWSDVFGFFTKFKPKFVRRYINGEEMLKEAIRRYSGDIISGNFPDDSESY